MAQSSDGTKAIALGLCREYEDKFLEHIAGGEVSKSTAGPAGLYIS
jgi:predicted transcriptional regulator YdeE